MIIAATSLAVALWERYGLIDAARRSSRKDARQTLSMCSRIDNVRSRRTPTYLSDLLKGTLFPPIFPHALLTKAIRDAERTGVTSFFFFLISVQLEFVAIHPDYNIANTCLNTGLNTVELIGRSTHLHSGTKVVWLFSKHTTWCLTSHHPSHTYTHTCKSLCRLGSKSRRFGWLPIKSCVQHQVAAAHLSRVVYTTDQNSLNLTIWMPCIYIVINDTVKPCKNVTR